MSFSKLWDNLNPLTRLPGSRSPRCIKSAEEFLQILKSERARADRYSHEFSLAFFHLENMDSSHATVRRLSHNKLEEYKNLVLVKNEIYQNMGKITDIYQLTKNLNLNYRLILSLLKQHEDTTLKNYLIDMKIGFCDLFHLSSVFKKKLGLDNLIR